MVIEGCGKRNASRNATSRFNAKVDIMLKAFYEHVTFLRRNYIRYMVFQVDMKVLDTSFHTMQPFALKVQTLQLYQYSEIVAS